jgi:hypothetical protein
MAKHEVRLRRGQDLGTGRRARQQTGRQDRRSQLLYQLRYSGRRQFNMNRCVWLNRPLGSVALLISETARGVQLDEPGRPSLGDNRITIDAVNVCNGTNLSHYLEAQPIGVASGLSEHHWKTSDAGPR